MSTKDVANFIATTNFGKLPSHVVTQAKIAIQDNLGVIIAAYKGRAVQADT